MMIKWWSPAGLEAFGFVLVFFYFSLVLCVCVCVVWFYFLFCLFDSSFIVDCGHF